MSNSIRLLSDTVANQIAAGEVVNRPSSVIKEMMENAVDAGASEITVNFRDGGKQLIQIIDNGSGMSQADARMCFDRHATSKITKVDDIYSLSTFGFRGEALASIAAVAEVDLTTRRSEDALATEVCISGGKFVSQQPKQGEVGTSFLVKNLFYNVPARRRFLDKSTTEARHISAEFQRVALCNEDKTFTLYNNDALLYSLECGSLKSRIVKLMGKHMEKNLLEVKTQTTIINIRGFVGSPSSSKQNNKDQFLFVNSRYFKSGYFHKAIMQAYDKLIPANTQPSYFLYLTIEPERIDVNVHPQKTEVKFDDNQAIWQIINASVRESLAKLGVVPMMDFDVEDAVEIPVAKSDSFVYREPTASINPNFNPFASSDFELDNSVSQPLGRDENKMGYDSMIMDYISGEEDTQSSMEFECDVVLGEILRIENGRFVATTINSLLALVDLKRAYSCVLYNRYKALLKNGNSPSSQLMFPMEVSLPVGELHACEAHRDELMSFGFDFKIVDDVLELWAVPADMTEGNTVEIFCKLLGMLSENEGDKSIIREEYLARIMARTGAFRELKTEAIEALIRELVKCEYVNYTPEGQKVITYLGVDEISKKFEK